MGDKQTFRTNAVDTIGTVALTFGTTFYFLLIYPRDSLLDKMMLIILVLFSSLTIANVYRKIEIDGHNVRFRSLLNRREISVNDIAKCEYCWLPGGRGFRWGWLKFFDKNDRVVIRFMFPGNLLTLKQTLRKHGIKMLNF